MIEKEMDAEGKMGKRTKEKIKTKKENKVRLELIKIEGKRMK
jgi:hypothetical protein